MVLFGAGGSGSAWLSRRGSLGNACNQHSPHPRLVLGVGKSESVTAAWIKFPELELHPLAQRYTRTAENIYRYEGDTGFSAEIRVDDLGLVTAYPRGWERIATF